jgi:hypothetical protein
MITSPRRRALSTPVHRRFESTRLQNQSLACAYEALIPFVSRRPEWPHDRPGDRQRAETRTENPRPSAVGA